MNAYNFTRRAPGLLILLVFLGVTSCSEEPTDANAKRLIGKYVSALPVAQKEGSFGLLTKVAAGPSVKKMSNSYQAYLNGQGIVLDAELLGLEFKEIQLGSGADEGEIVSKWYEDELEWREKYIFKETVVSTEERWRYKWVDAETEEPASPLVTAMYTMKYTIDKVGDKLMIISAEIKGEHIEDSVGDADKWKQGTVRTH